jgi:hypothetical protein
MSIRFLKGAAMAVVCLTVVSRVNAQSTPYYIAAGDQTLMTVVQGGTIVDTFSIPFLGYPIAVQNTIWLGHRDDAGATEFSLAGIPTGNTSSGGNNFFQLLDGTTNGINNFGVECCGSPNSVTIANLDWSNQTPLFTVPNGENGEGITYDPTTGHLFVGTFNSILYELDLAGNVINTFPSLPSVRFSSLAYERATDTLWTARGQTVWQLSKTGVVLQSFTVNGSFQNNYGGEMPFSRVPEPSLLTLLAGSVIFAMNACRRRRVR